MGREDIKHRIAMLADEMDANDEENRMNQKEIDELYEMLDALPKEVK